MLLGLGIAVAGCGSGATSSGPRVVSPPPPEPAGTYSPGETVVSLTFDDGRELLWPARDILLANHVHGTFFIISLRVGLPAYMTLQQLQTLQQDGNEIGGHTLDHLPNLAAIPQAQQQHEVCDDRQTLLSWGFPAVTFAYPFDNWSPGLESVVRGCGYSQARMAHGIRNATQTSSPPAGTIPPQDPFGVAAVPSIQSTATLGELQGYVTAAQQAGGGWVILIFHKLCDPICAPNAITPTLFSQLTSWLTTQPNTAVLPVREVMALKKTAN